MGEDPLEPNDVNTLLILKKIFSILSLIVLIFISMLFWFSKKIKKRITNICILYLTIIEIGYLISILLPYNINNPDSNLCFAETLLINFFHHCRLAWCFLMAHICILESMNKISFENHHILCSIIFIIILILIPFPSSIFLLYNFTAIKLCFIIITFYCILQSKKNKKIFRKVSNYKNNHKYLMYPKLICWLQTADLSTNIYKIVLINSSTFWVELLHIFLNCSEGIFIFIIFIRSTLFQILFSRFYKNFKKNRGNKRKRGNTFKSINSLINDKKNTPLIDGDANNEDN